MPPTSVSLRKLKKLYRDVQRISRNFQQLDPRILVVLFAFVKSNFSLSQRDREELRGPYDMVFTDVGKLVRWLSSSRSQYGPNLLGLHAAYNA